MNDKSLPITNFKPYGVFQKSGKNFFQNVFFKDFAK